MFWFVSMSRAGRVLDSSTSQEAPVPDPVNLSSRVPGIFSGLTPDNSWLKIFFRPRARIVKVQGSVRQGMSKHHAASAAQSALFLGVALVTVTRV